MRLAIAQITSDPGKIEGNVEKILSYIEKARSQGAELVVFPELSIPGYNLMDLAFNDAYIDANLTALTRIRQSTQGITVIVGFIDRADTGGRIGNRARLYNSAAILRDGKILGQQNKSLLPDYDIFFENRYFLSAEQRDVFDVNGVRIGLQVCEDLWDEGYPVKVSEELIRKGADVLINLSASPFHVGKIKDRIARISALSKSNRLPFVYANLVGSFDGFDGEVVFDGRSLIVDSEGALLEAGKAFEEDLLLCDLFKAQQAASQSPLPESETSEAYEALVLGIREYYRRQGFLHAYIGLSGGIDSAVVAALAVAALGADRVVGVTMPSHVTSDETRSDALKLAANLQIRCDIRSIAPEYAAWLESFEKQFGRPPENLTKQNKQARIRGSILMEYSNEDRRGLVLSTGNKTELALGYCTLYGDMCGGLAVISDCSKNRVYEIARYINHRSGRELIPESIIERVPTAELEHGQTDRDNLPADYPIISPLVDDIVEGGMSPAELAAKYPAKVIESTMRLININEYKRRQAAPGIRITKRAFGIGRRVPMGHGFPQ